MGINHISGFGPDSASSMTLLQKQKGQAHSKPGDAPKKNGGLAGLEPPNYGETDDI